jgi:hypothetical protein
MADERFDCGCTIVDLQGGTEISFCNEHRLTASDLVSELQAGGEHTESLPKWIADRISEIIQRSRDGQIRLEVIASKVVDIHIERRDA